MSDGEPTSATTVSRTSGDRATASVGRETLAGSGRGAAGAGAAVDAGATGAVCGLRAALTHTPASRASGSMATARRTWGVVPVDMRSLIPPVWCPDRSGATPSLTITTGR